MSLPSDDGCRLPFTISRRDLLRGGVAAGASLVLGVGWPGGARGATEEGEGPAVLAPDAFVEIDSEGGVTVWISRQEMGQGVRTALPMIVAEELDVDWARVRVRQAPLDERYGNQRTGGSTSVTELWDPLRRTGAAAREMLLAAAALRWGVPRAELATAEGVVLHAASGRRAPYGELVESARRLPVPEAAGLTLKAAADYRLLGTSPPPVDGQDIVTGRARYGIDASLPGMLYASFERCPVIGGRVESLDPRRALAVPGVKGVFPVDGSGVSWMLQWARGVAVVAESSWAALAGREALEVVWDEGPNAGLDQGEILADLAAACSEPGTVTRRDGNVEAALAGGEPIVADYVAPYLSHSPVEPMNCVVDARSDRCRILAPVQFPHLARDLAARALGLDPARVEVEPTLVGGGFGRRIYADYVGEAALISKAAGAPVQLLWTRQDDTRHGFYRPLSYHRLAARLDGTGGVLAWRHRIAGPSRDAVSGPDVETPERSEVYGFNEMPYAIPNVQVEFRHRYVPLPCGPWRAVAYSQAGQVIEGFVDELAHAAGVDPVAFRRRLLAAAAAATTADDSSSRVHPSRLVAVLDLAAKRAGWGRPLPAGRGRGVAVTADHGSCVAHVAEVSVAGGVIRVERMVSAVDCGQLVHREMAIAQVEGAVALALSATLKSEITLRRGRVEQGSYADYDVIRMGEMPEVEVHFVPSVQHPTGLGEPPLPGVAPAVLNAVFAATGRRLRRIPVRRLE